MIEVGDFFLRFFLMVFNLFWQLVVPLEVPKTSNFKIESIKNGNLPPWDRGGSFFGQSSRPSIRCFNISMSLSKNLVLPVFLDLISIKVW